VYGWMIFPIGLAMPTGSTLRSAPVTMLMVTVLRRLNGSGHGGAVSEPLRLCRAAAKRGPALPRRAFAAQLAVFTGKR